MRRGVVLNTAMRASGGRGERCARDGPDGGGTAADVVERSHATAGLVDRPGGTRTRRQPHAPEPTPPEKIIRRRPDGRCESKRPSGRAAARGRRHGTPPPQPRATPRHAAPRRAAPRRAATNPDTQLLRPPAGRPAQAHGSQVRRRQRKRRRHPRRPAPRRSGTSGAHRRGGTSPGAWYRIPVSDVRRGPAATSPTRRARFPRPRSRRPRRSRRGTPSPARRETGTTPSDRRPSDPPTRHRPRAPPPHPRDAATRHPAPPHRPAAFTAWVFPA
jgi:hypothetical protein